MEKKRFLIVNADDYGRTPGVSHGIREAHRGGIVTSASALMNMPWIEEDLRIALRETPDLGLGVHLVLTCGTPLRSPDLLESITGGRESLPGLEEFVRNLAGVDPDQAAAEWEAQILRFIELAGRNPDHLDSHHHVSYFTEALFRRFLELARKYQSAVRVPYPTLSEIAGLLPAPLAETAQEFLPRLTRGGEPPKPDRFIGTFYGEGATQEHLLLVLDQLEPGVAELMCHPGFADPALIHGSSYGKMREREIDILTSDSVRRALARRGIQLVNYFALLQAAR
ncbi:MAG: ChbG/HpnK family deacetylase [Anaerolineales bacterium]|nr:ChbG/HpnK family deacetylase [Anaerolineales bacterium]